MVSTIVARKSLEPRNNNVLKRFEHTMKVQKGGLKLPDLRQEMLQHMAGGVAVAWRQLEINGMNKPQVVSLLVETIVANQRQQESGRSRHWTSP